jgi:hypothetical protein
MFSRRDNLSSTNKIRIATNVARNFHGLEDIFYLWLEGAARESRIQRQRCAPQPPRDKATRRLAFVKRLHRKRAATASSPHYVNVIELAKESTDRLHWIKVRRLGSRGAPDRIVRDR